jgi:hypothetical protein
MPWRQGLEPTVAANLKRNRNINSGAQSLTGFFDSMIIGLVQIQIPERFKYTTPRQVFVHRATMPIQQSLTEFSPVCQTKRSQKSRSLHEKV